MFPDGKRPAGTLAQFSTGHPRIASFPNQADSDFTALCGLRVSDTRHNRANHLDSLGPWIDTPSTSERGNDLLRATWLLIDEAVAIVNEAAPVDDGLVAELFEEASDIERKLFEVRSAETVEAMRSWRANAESQAVKAVAGNG